MKRYVGIGVAQEECALCIVDGASDQLHLILAARERLIPIGMDIEGQVRWLLKTYGIRFGVGVR